MRVDDAELLDEFIQEQAVYSSDLKALVLRFVHQRNGDVQAVSQETGIAASTIYQWLESWNNREKGSKKKPV
jgi:transposase-like protein